MITRCFPAKRTASERLRHFVIILDNTFPSAAIFAPFQISLLHSSVKLINRLLMVFSCFPDSLPPFAILCSELSCGNFCHLGRKLIMPQVIRLHFLSLHSIVNFCFLFNVPLNIFIHLLPRDHISVPGYPKSLSRECVFYGFFQFLIKLSLRYFTLQRFQKRRSLFYLRSISVFNFSFALKYAKHCKTPTKTLNRLKCIRELTLNRLSL